MVEAAAGANVLGGAVQGGRPLPESVRNFFEPRFGYDFDHVRIHTDDRSSAAAEALNAEAFVIGRNIVFGAGKFSPDAEEGKKLIGHELQHIVQRGKPNSFSVQGDAYPGDTVRRKEKPGKKVFYQSVLDAIASEKSQVVHFTRTDFGGWALPFLQKVERLCKAVEKEDKPEIPAAVKELVKEDPSPVYPYRVFMEVGEELISRLLLIGMENESAEKRSFYLKGKRKELVGRFPRRSIEMDLWGKIVDDALARAKTGSETEAVASLDMLLMVYRNIRDEAAGLDQEEIARDRKSQAEFSRLMYSDSLPSVDLPGSELSVSTYYERLLKLLPPIFISVQAAFQVLIDAAIQALGSGKGPESLNDARSALEEKIKPAILPEIKSKYSGRLSVEITKSEFKEHGGRHVDYFSSGKKTAERSATFHYYNPDQAYGIEKQLTLERVYLIRAEQIKFLEHMFGVERDPAKANEAKQDAAIVGGMKGFSLHGNDDWREFLDKKYEAEKKDKGPGAALTSVIKFLEWYLRAFTVHSPYDIDDFTESPFKETFPRAMTGGVIHDCGIYALRIAYMLSLIRGKLNLRFRFIRLPVHVGLLITGGGGLPAFIAHNDLIDPIPAEKIADLQQEWQSLDRTGKKTASPGNLDETQFFAELATGYFIPGVDTPFRFEDMPLFRGSNLKEKYFDFFKKKVHPDVIASDRTSEAEQLPLRYLDLIETYKEIHNNELMKFWIKDAVEYWNTDGQSLIAALDELQKASADQKRAVLEKYKMKVEDIKQGFDRLQGPLNKKIEDLEKKKMEIGKLLQDHPSLVSKGASIAYGQRLPITYRWKIEIIEYFQTLDDMTDLDDKKKKERIIPPFLSKKMDYAD